MNILKKRVSLILAIMMMALAIFPLTGVIASSDTADVSMSVKLNGTELEKYGTYKVQAGQQIIVNAKSNNGSSIEKIGAYYADEGRNKMQEAFDGKALVITLPQKAAGAKRKIRIEAVAKNNTGEDDPKNRTFWQTYYLEYEDTVANKAITVKYDGKTVAPQTKTEAYVGDSVSISAAPSNRVKKLYYA